MSAGSSERTVLFPGGHFARSLKSLLSFRGSPLSPLGRLNIRTRLRVAFASLMSLMAAGSALSLWQFREVAADLGKASDIERRLTAVLELDNSILTLMNKLHRAADARQPEPFETAAGRLLADFQSQTVGIPAELSRVGGMETGRRRVLLNNLLAVLDDLPSRINGLTELARAGDWPALHARLANQVDHTDDVLSALQGELNSDLTQTRAALIENVSRAEGRTALILIFTGVFSLAAAALLGMVVTKSITVPLSNLDAGARALAKGDFAHQVEVTGSDELGNLATVFNWMAGELQTLYAKIRRREARFRALIEKTSDLILVANRAGELIYASPSSLGVLGYSPVMLAGQRLREYAHPEDVPLVDELFGGESLLPGTTRTFEWRFRRHDDSYRIVEGIASNLLADESVRGIVVNARDVTERRQSEQMLRDREDQLRQAQKMEAIGQLAGGVAHDFNNLLTAINGYADLLMSTVNTRDSAHSWLKEIRDAGERATDLTRQLLAFSRRQVLQPEVVDLNGIVRDTERLLRRVIGEDVELACNLDPAAGAVKADPNQLHQLLMNLAVNARDAMPAGGKLTITTANALDPAAPGLSGEEARADYVELKVSDTGSGMDEATRQRIFEPFFTTKEKGKGTGLGLSIVYGVVRQSGGHITVDTEPGRGATFRILLPRVEAAAGQASLSKASDPPRGTETILLVEDQPEVRRFAATCLRSYGYRVLEASNGEEALRLYRETSGPIQITVTDVVMPGMTGVDLSKKLQSLSPSAKVLFVSGYADSVILRHGVLDSNIPFLQKPYSPSALIQKIREVLGQELDLS
jgi:PAS domain S-box-containing protein